MKRILKRNQIIITVIAIMIAIAGYINYIGTSDDEAKLANSEIIDLASNDVDGEDISLMEPGTAILTSTGINNNGILSEVKLNREQTRASNKELLFQIIDNQNLDESAKKSAVDKVVVMTDVAEREMACELLLEAKGFGECIVTIVEDSVDVVVGVEEIDDINRAQIEDIIKRKTECKPENIVISSISTMQ